MSNTKEPAFFSQERLYNRGLAWYHRKYFNPPSHALAIGEATPWYLYSAAAAQRIKASYGSDNVRIIVSLRNPVQRAYSMYWDQRALAKEDRSFIHALHSPVDSDVLAQDAPSAGLIQAYLLCGRYAQFLESWFSIFGRSRIKVILFEELTDSARTTQVLGELWDFLGLSPPSRDCVPIANPSKMFRSQRIARTLNTARSAPPAVKTAIRSTAGEGRMGNLVEALSRLNRRSFEYPPLAPDTAAEAFRVYEEEIMRLERLLHRDLDQWWYV